MELYTLPIPDAGGECLFELRDRLKHPMFFWPETLLHYRLAAPSDAKLTALLTDGDGNIVPSQIWREGGQTLLAFTASLESGGRKCFHLKSGPADTIIEPRPLRLPARIHNDFCGFEISADGTLSLLDENHTALATGHFSGVQPTSVSAEILEGEVFTRVTLTYRFDSVRSCRHTLTLARKMRHMQLREEMTGFRPEDGASYLLDWSALAPTHRQFPNHPMPGGSYGKLEYEKLDDAVCSTHNGLWSAIRPDGEMSVHLGVYQNWAAYETVNSALFWNADSRRSAGIFIDDPLYWNDHEYAVWNSSMTLQIRFLLKSGTLFWRFPLAEGSRSTCIALYPSVLDDEIRGQLEHFRTEYKDFNISACPTSYIHFCQTHYNTLSLDKYKDWQLTYPRERLRADSCFEKGCFGSAEEMLRYIRTSGLICGIPYHGDRENGGFGVTAFRCVGEILLDGFERLQGSADDETSGQLTAWLLMLAYLSADEEYMPMVRMIGGHPNFLSDAKSTPALIAYLFPEHEMAGEWRDMCAAMIALNLRFHTRPDRSEYSLIGGRWTENTGTYVWAFLRPVLEAAWLNANFGDGTAMICCPEARRLGKWLLHSLSCPIGYDPIAKRLGEHRLDDKHNWGMVVGDEPRRVHLPQGAHSARRIPARLLWVFAHMFENYDPILSQQLLYVTRPTDEDMESPRHPDCWDTMYLPRGDGYTDRGTRPRLGSVKMTGYGITLRAAENTPDEMFLHIQQLDDGYNYRWGVQAEGGCGVMYYYAAGACYSHNGKEDVGDRWLNTGDFACLFSVWSGGGFRSIGRGELTGRLCDYENFRYCELFPKPSFIEYLYKNLLMIRSDYCIDYEALYSKWVTHRFSWFADLDDPELNIHILRGGNEHTRLESSSLRGSWYDGTGDFLALLTHKPLDVTATAEGALVKAGDYTDHISIGQNITDIFFGNVRLSARIAIISEDKSGGLSVSAVDVRSFGSEAFAMTFSAPVILSWQAQECRLFISEPTALSVDSNEALFLSREPMESGSRTLDPGEYKLGIGQPTAPDRLMLSGYSLMRRGAAIVTDFDPALRIEAEYSLDEAAYFPADCAVEDNRPIISGLPAGKTYVRLRAVDPITGKAGQWSDDLAIFNISEPPEYPRGLAVSAISENRVSLIRGNVSGASGYRLYYRRRGDAAFERVEFPENELTLTLDGILPPKEIPGDYQQECNDSIWEFAVTAYNAFGESPKSPLRDANPAGWLNWQTTIKRHSVK